MVREAVGAGAGLDSWPGAEDGSGAGPGGGGGAGCRAAADVASIEMEDATTTLQGQSVWLSNRQLMMAKDATRHEKMHQA